MPFLKPREKTVSKEQLRSFWKDWQEGRRARKPINLYRSRKIIALTQTIIATVRKFPDKQSMEKYKERTTIIESSVIASKPKRFELQKGQFFGQEGNYLLERVYRAPTLLDLQSEKITEFGNRYSQTFIRRLKRKGIDYEKIKTLLREDATAAWNELTRISVSDINCIFDIAASNFIALDYNPKERKFLIAIIDHGGSIRE